MADLLKRSFAPLTAEAWEEVDEAARQIFKAQLTARTLVDFDGPHGWEHAGVNLGRVEAAKAASGGVPWGLRSVLPLIEVRVPLVLGQWELDNAGRGCKDVDLEPLEEAARKVAFFEETAIFKGFDKGQIKGICQAAAHKTVRLPGNVKQYAQAVAQALKTLQTAGIGGPYALVLGTEPYHALIQSGEGGYPPRRIVRDMLGGGPIAWSRALDGGVLMSVRGGDFEMTVGQDLSIGYQSHDSEEVHLFITESFTFRTLEPAAAVELKAASR